MKPDYFKRRKKSIFHPATLLLMVICTLLNVFLSMMVRATDLPLYIDTVGTIIATALGGLIPGILTAFATNAVNFLMDGEAVFYASLNMLIAMVSALWFSGFASHRKKRLHEKRQDADEFRFAAIDLLLYIMVLALIGGVFGAGITWYLYGSPSDAPIIVKFSSWLFETTGLGVFGCHIVSGYMTDLLDKAISVFIALLVIRMVPGRLKDAVRMSHWKQKPMSRQQLRAAGKKNNSQMPIGMRINLILILSILFMMIIASVFSAISLRESIVESLSTQAGQIAFLASKEIDPDKVDEYISRGYAADGYDKVRGRLAVIKSSLSSIEFLYVFRVEKDGCRVVFDLDSPLSSGVYVEGDRPGTVRELEDAFIPYREAMLEGKHIPPVRIEDEYGSFIAASYPVTDSSGRCVCYAVSNIDYGLVNTMLERYFGRILLLMSGFLLLIMVISILTTRYHVVMPIVGMTVCANELMEKGGAADKESLSKIEELDIRTGDEIERLYRTFCKMTGDTLYQLSDNRSKSEAIANMQSALIITMADMVESRDADTGAHVLKTAGYVRIILHGLKRSGYYAEKLTDKYMRDVEMSAPLHDVGKINIPDAVLNKPGKLTDEEYAIMKSHTTAGKDIMENAISSMEGDNYLKEARNMAAYHHERWDGKGYPEGLHGEVIPLSARIMAVADVFDALSSPRVYKPAFPFDKAMEMVKEGAGTQFDPKCVEVFAESIAEVRKIHKRYQEL